MHGNKCNDIEGLAETSETFDGEHCTDLNGPYDLADIITGRRTVSCLSCVEKYGYLTKYYCPSDLEFLFKKKVVKSGETKTLSYQLLWTKRKWWHTYSTKYFITSVFQKISKHEIKNHNKALEKAKYFVKIFKDPTKAVTHGKHEDDKYQNDFHILKLTTEAVLLCAEQKIAFRDHQEQSNYTKNYH